MKYLREDETYEETLRWVQGKLKSQERLLESCGNVEHWKVGLHTLGCIVEALQQAHERIQELESVQGRCKDCTHYEPSSTHVNYCPELEKVLEWATHVWPQPDFGCIHFKRRES